MANSRGLCRIYLWFPNWISWLSQNLGLYSFSPSMFIICSLHPVFWALMFYSWDYSHTKMIAPVIRVVYSTPALLLRITKSFVWRLQRTIGEMRTRVTKIVEAKNLEGELVSAATFTCSHLLSKSENSIFI